MTLVFVPALLSVMIELQQLIFGGRRRDDDDQGANDEDGRIPLQHLSETVQEERIPSSLAS